MADKIRESPKGTHLNRRDFLKFGTTVIAGLALDRYISRESDQSKEGSNWRILEGADWGLYVPIYEHHSKPWPAEYFQGMPDADVVMYEVTRSSKDMAGKDAEGLVGKADKSFVRDRWIPLDQLEYWSQRGTFIAFEGLAYPSTSIAMKYSFGTLLEGLVGLNLMAKSFSEKTSKPLKIADREIMNSETKKMLMELGGIWGLSSWLQIGINTYLNMMTTNGSEGMQNASLKLQRLGQLTAQMHPEFDVVFLRNLIMTRRLQALKEKFPQQIRNSDRQENSPTTVAFNVGAMHSGIEDWLLLGTDIVKFMIELSPNGIWKQMNEINGGPENMATMPLVLQNGMVGSGVLRIKDDWLQKILERKTS